jgi:hypothetical protein
MDMLRYDSAWPVDTTDARAIEASFDPNFNSGEDRNRHWTVRLNSADRMAPTRRRWDSFNVQVENG